MDTGDDGVAKSRLDNFVDAAFAFALTLLVIGGGAMPESFGELRNAMAAAPAFAVGFALVATFWHGHVRWRKYGGGSGMLATVLSLLLVFLVLLYVYPLRLMAQSLVAYASGTIAARFELGDLPGIFQLYGLGFAAMSACAALLFRSAIRTAPTPECRGRAEGELVVWTIMFATGAISALFASFRPLWVLAPWAYSTLPITIPLTVRLLKRRAERPPAEAGH